MKRVYRADEASAWALFESEPWLHLSGQGGAGPILRTYNGVVVDGALVFHTGGHGESRELLGREVVAQVERPLGVIPSYFVDPELACPATTYFLSAQARGVLQEVQDPAEKARCLEALMARYQPEGGHAPVRADDPRYAKVVQGLCVASLRPREVVAKHKLGQNRSGRVIEGVQTGLWRRGEGGDLALIRTLREQHPQHPCPAALRVGEQVVLCPAPDAGDASSVAALLGGQYWTGEESPARLVESQMGSAAWLVARHPEQGVIGSARAITDGVRRAFVMDVVVTRGARGSGVGTALVRALLDHPRLRGVGRIELGTRDAQGFYARLGFAELSESSAHVRMGRLSA